MVHMRRKEAWRYEFSMAERRSRRMWLFLLLQLTVGELENTKVCSAVPKRIFRNKFDLSNYASWRTLIKTCVRNHMRRYGSKGTVSGTASFLARGLLYGVHPRHK